MTAARKRQRPLAGGRRASQNTFAGNPTRRPTGRKGVWASTRGALPAGWRDRLPDPARYFAAHVERLGKPSAAGWAQACCPFHEDREPSLSVNVTTGAWRCFGCGEHGDLIGFHQRRTGLAFLDAVRDLLGGRP